MRKGIGSLMLAATLAVSLLTGCKRGSVQTDATKEIAKAEETGGVSEGTKDNSKAGEGIVVYTNSGSDGRDEWLTNKAKEAGFEVQVVSLGASEMSERMIAEKNNSLCDVVFGLNSIEYEKLKANELIQTWKPDWVDGVDAELIDTDGYYYPVTITPLLLIGNADFKDMPSDWTDLVKDKYKNKYQIHGLGGGTGKTIFASIISRYADEEGELGISDEGWEIAEKYLGNAHRIASGEDNIGQVINGAYPLSMHWGSGVLAEEKARNYDFQIMTPEVGEPFAVESVAITKGTKKYDDCVDFLNWLGSSEVQLQWSDRFGTIPCQKEALLDASDDVKAFMEHLKAQDLDWEFISKNIDAWVEKAELEYVR